MNTQFRPGKAWTIVALLTFLQLVNFVDKIVIGLVAVPMMTELKLTPVQFGLIGGSFFWLFAISGVVVGMIANRVKTTHLLLGMAVLWSLVQLPMIFTSSIAMIVVARVILGAGEGPAAPVANHAVYKWFPDSRRSLPVTVMNAGASVALVLSGLLIPMITQAWGWRANFIVLALVGLAWAVAWRVFGEEGTLVERKATHGAAPASGRRIPYARLLTDRSAIGIMLLHFVAYWGLALTLTWLPAYIQRGLGYSAVDAGRMFALVVLLGVPVNLALSWWSQRLLVRGASSRGARGVLSSLALVVGGVLFCTLMAFDLGPVQKICIIAIASGLAPIVYSLGPAMMGEITPDTQRGGMLAVENSVASLAGIAAPVVMGRLIEANQAVAAHGYELGFAVSGGLLIAGGLLGLVLVNPARSLSVQRARAQADASALSPAAG
ncbi:sugar phosphate permease [Variovorax sp. 54]|uniref:MFS transporter n=1 Tax=Variovorax sp. 54 TaxID=2035212 RepID=UPI000C1990DB|nr:MFS transporter [Variovorax sp. 54]PIF74806.1 sugar phosphate permease [Variovorax sp. 54]